MNGLNKSFKNNKISFSTNQIGGMFGFFFYDNLPKNLNDVENTNDKQFISFINQSINKGIYFAPSKFEAGFISTKHTKNEINTKISIVKIILEKGI